MRGGEGSHGCLISWSQTADMSLAGRALVSLAVVIAAAVAIAWLGNTIAVIVGGAVLSPAILVFTRAIMSLASEPDEERQ